MGSNDTLQMTISSVMRKEKGKVVYVRFERREGEKVHFAEGVIPDCTFEKSYGFSDEEMAQLKFYLKENVAEIFEQAQKINDKEIWLR